MELKPGTQLGSTCCTTQVVVVRPPSSEVKLTCGGQLMVPAAEATDTSDAILDGHDGGTQMGKRYQHEESGMELLCTKAGDGALAVNGELVGTKEAKAVPSSD